MTGKEYILYILENNLENESIFREDGTLRGFISDMDAAVKFGVGRMTIAVWVNDGKIPGVRINDILMIPETAKDPRCMEESNESIKKIIGGKLDILPRHGTKACRG